MSDSTSNQQQQESYTDNRAVLGQGSMQATGGSTITNYTLDGQAVSRSLDTVDRSLQLVGSTNGAALDFGRDALGTVAGFGGRVLDQVAGTETLVANAYNDAKGQGALTQKILIAAVVGALFVALVAVQKKA